MRHSRRILAVERADAFTSAPTLAFAQAAGDGGDAGVHAGGARTGALNLATRKLYETSTQRRWEPNSPTSQKAVYDIEQKFLPAYSSLVGESPLAICIGAVDPRRRPLRHSLPFVVSA
jgi:hypothetical protein